ncbi:MAG: hypothetical protein DHS20C12_07420 [Pseudohongiella sp.]|nr:MAG: hypothetical protein DHS20C12_07420 [Pseudohongiella sp.]
MLGSILSQYARTLSVFGALLLIVLIEMLGIRESVYPDLLPFFTWMRESSWLGLIGTTYGSIYATVEAVHLLSMAVLGGTVLATDLRLLGVIFKDIPSETLVTGTHKCFRWALLIAVLTGIFCAAGVGDKVYYMQVFWIKMLVLILGSCFMLFIKQPFLTSRPHAEIDPWMIRLLAITSILIWFTVAATGRWIGFS